MTARSGVVRVMALVACVAGEAAEPAAGAPAGCELTAATRLSMGSGSQSAGDVGTNQIGGRVSLGPRATLADATILRGDLVRLREGASVFDVEANVLTRAASAIVRGGLDRPELPRTDPSCAIPPIACGGEHLLVERLESRVLTPGTYGRLAVRDGAAVSFAPGAYVFCEVQAGRNVLLSIASGSPSAIDVSGGLRVGNGSALVVSPGTAVPQLRVGGERVKVGHGAELDALVRAPRARVTIARGTRFVGGACARTLDLGREAVHTCADTVPTTTTTTIHAATTTSSTSSTSTTTTIEVVTTTSSTSLSTSSSTTTPTTVSSTSSTSSTAGPTTTSSSTTSTTTTTTSTTTIPAGCGNGTVNTGETCDDGNNGDNDSCPADCRIAACSPLTVTQRFVQVRFAPPEGGLVAGLTLLLDYPEGQVELPNNVVNGQVVTTSFPSGTISGTPTGASVSVNDLSFQGKGHAARITIGSTAALTPGQVMRFRFQDCSGAVAPTASQFPCTVLVASDPFSNPVAGATCFVVVE